MLAAATKLTGNILHVVGFYANYPQVHREMKSKMQSVEMLPAFSWICDNCGQNNFTSAVVAEFSEEEMQELRDEHGVQPWEAGEFLQKPDEVQCSKCARRFTTTDYRE